MIKKLLRSYKGEGYIDVCVGVVAFVIVLVISINIFSFITLKVEMDRIADELIESAAYSGEFGEDFLDTDTYLKNEYFYYETDCGSDSYFNSALKRVQLGERMWVSISKDTYVKGLGVFKIPVTLTVTKSGLSEKYWK